MKMALVAYSAIVDAVRGRMGTDVFSRGQSGPTTRVYRVGKRSRTAAQATVRNIF